MEAPRRWSIVTPTGSTRLVDLVWALVDTHAVFADLGGEAGAIAADWLRGIGLAGLPDL